MLVGKWSGRLLLTSLTVAGLMGVSAQATPTVEYSAGHADIGLAYESGELELHYHFGAGAVLDGVTLVSEDEADPGEVYVRVADSTQTTGTALSFLGNADPYWALPQNNVAGQPFLGIAAEELSGSEFSSASLEMTGFSGPGQFALWQWPNSAFMQTVDGISPSDTLPLVIGGHDHFNFGFTAEGVYQVTITATAELTGGSTVTDTETFWFVVGDNTVIPEPASLALLGLGGGLVLMRRRASSKR